MNPDRVLSQGDRLFCEYRTACRVSLCCLSFRLDRILPLYQILAVLVLRGLWVVWVVFACVWCGLWVVLCCVCALARGSCLTRRRDKINDRSLDRVRFRPVAGSVPCRAVPCRTASVYVLFVHFSDSIHFSFRRIENARTNISLLMVAYASYTRYYICVFQPLFRGFRNN